ncbi:hypothetical protein CYLTODRAFT_359325 [Cylindrobasidium torrendii FP15055 ss-10]|uniref:BAR domain-containing protein n=1 Tax=Cylindrobasidium torrendii FP15055 ss-10 TaxID=1314674 RepID=A0A0D7B032_9AGAR|nr:hypothetical protein CYLTODRAFT_359325 [Cylindrobasidium torrendii FP15055 ss-10]
MENWNKIRTSIGEIKFGEQANKLAKELQSTVQLTRERLGQVAVEDITELPQEYKDLEARVDALRNAHIAMLKITNVYATEQYDYPVQVQESLAEFGSTVSAGFSALASAAGRPVSPPVEKVPQHKTLPHALTRASHTAATALPPSEKLTIALSQYAVGWEKVASARVSHDVTIQERFLEPWQRTLNTGITAAVKARSAVERSRLELDAAKLSLKSAGPQRQERAQLNMENCEDDLVQKTEVAITLMKTVLDNPEPLKQLNELVKAQLSYFAQAAEVLTDAQGQIDDLAIQAEEQYRCVVAMRRSSICILTLVQADPRPLMYI